MWRLVAMVVVVDEERGRPLAAPQMAAGQD